MPSLCSLGGNGLKDEGTTIICDALRDSKVSKLKELVLWRNGITVTGAESVAAYLAVTAELTALDVRYHRLGEDGEALLRQAVQGRSGFDLKIEG